MDAETGLRTDKSHNGQPAHQAKHFAGTRGPSGSPTADAQTDAQQQQSPRAERPLHGESIQIIVPPAGAFPFASEIRTKPAVAILEIVALQIDTFDEGRRERNGKRGDE
jgi:hypothetical protein